MTGKRKSSGLGMLPLWNSWFNVACKTGEMLTASAFVINDRTRRMAQSPTKPTKSDLNEMSRMVTEKIEAVLESCSASAVALMKLQGQHLAGSFWLSMHGLGSPAGTRGGSQTAKTMARRTDKLLVSAADCAEAALDPFRKRAVANRKRLTKRPG